MVWWRSVHRRTDVNRGRRQILAFSGSIQTAGAATPFVYVRRALRSSRSATTIAKAPLSVRDKNAPFKSQQNQTNTAEFIALNKKNGDRAAPLALTAAMLQLEIGTTGA